MRLEGDEPSVLGQRELARRQQPAVDLAVRAVEELGELVGVDTDVAGSVTSAYGSGVVRRHGPDGSSQLDEARYSPEWSV